MIGAGKAFSCFAKTTVFLLFSVWITVHVFADGLRESSVRVGGQWLTFGCRTLDSIEDYEVKPENFELSKYGGWKAHRVEATGFFRVEQIDGRWWAVDPEGYLYVHKAINSVNLNDYTADQIYTILSTYGFNGLGCWSDEDILESQSKEVTPLAYCPKISFVAEYRRERVPRIEIPIFDDEFEAYCDELAKGFLPYVDDPQVFGYLSDNELNWRDEGLPAHLALNDASDKNYTTAIAFLAERGKTANNWDADDQYAYIGLMAERYYSVVSSAIRKVDTNHMYIGSRCHSTEKFIEAFMVNAGKYVDVFSINHYGRWGAREVEISNMSDWSGRPLMITEFYAMEDFPGEEDGAGWLVADQASRGPFYQHYVSTLAETGDLVGWHWFKYQDDKNGNKGVVSEDGELFSGLLDEMEEMNRHIYNFIDYVDTRRDPDETLFPEADAYFKGGENFGEQEQLLVKEASSAVLRRTYIRFDLSGIEGEVSGARIRINSVATGSESSNYRAELVSDNTWGETDIVSSNSPDGSTVLAEWSHGDDIEIDGGGEVLAALAGDKKLSIRILSVLNNGEIAVYGSREQANPIARPKLYIEYVGLHPYEVWASEMGLVEGVDRGYSDDPDADGIENLLEYACGGDPLKSDAIEAGLRFSPVKIEGGDAFEFVYRRRVDPEVWGLDYIVETSTALGQFAGDGVSQEIASELIYANFEKVTNRVPIEVDSQQFVKLKVILK